MESINVFKGYGKLNLSIEDQSSNQQLQQQQRSKRRATLIFSITGILVLTLVICLMMATLFHEKYEDDDEDDNNTMSQSLVSVSEDAIKAVCNITFYPTSCFTSITSLVISTCNHNNDNFTTKNKPDPEAIFKLSLIVSTSQLKNLTTLFQALNYEDSSSAVGDCLSLFEDGLDRINQSVFIMDVAGEKALTFKKVSDIRTWISAAMTDQDTCVDGLQEMGSSASQVLLDEVKEAMERTKELLSNSLAIAANMQSLLDKFGLEMH